MKTTSWGAYIANLALGGIGGSFIGGATGCTLAITSTVADEFLIDHNITNKHYLASTALWSSLIIPFSNKLAQTFPNHAIPIYGASAALVPIITYFGNDILNYQKKIDDVIDNFWPIIKLFDDHQIFSEKEVLKFADAYKAHDVKKIITLGVEDFYHISTNKIITNLTGRFALDLIQASLNTQFMKYAANNGTTLLAVTLIAQNPSANSSELAFLGSKICGFMVLKKFN